MDLMRTTNQTMGLTMHDCVVLEECGCDARNPVAKTRVLRYELAWLWCYLMRRIRNGHADVGSKILKLVSQSDPRRG